MASEPEVQVVDPGGTGHPIEEIWAYIVVHDDGDEAIASAWTTGGHIPLVTGSQDMVAKLHPIAVRIDKVIRRTGKRIKMVRFTKLSESEL